MWLLRVATGGGGGSSSSSLSTLPHSRVPPPLPHPHPAVARAGECMSWGGCLHPPETPLACLPSDRPQPQPWPLNKKLLCPAFGHPGRYLLASDPKPSHRLPCLSKCGLGQGPETCRTARGLLRKFPAATLSHTWRDSSGDGWLVAA